MEADILRLILFLVGAALIFGIYMADRYKQNKPKKPASDRVNVAGDESMVDHIEPSWDSFNEPEAEQDMYESHPAGDEAADIPVPGAVTEGVDERITSELEQLEEILHQGDRPVEVDDEVTLREQMSISFFASENRQQKQPEQENLIPTKIIQLNIVPHEGEFNGDDILRVVDEVGLELGEMNIFHHYGGDQEKKHAIYSMVSMVEPGGFPDGDMEAFSTPGLTIFARLPGSMDGLRIFADMLNTAEQLADMLDGELCDETHSTLSKQAIGHIREEIQEHHRQLQLARSKQ